MEDPAGSSSPAVDSGAASPRPASGWSVARIPLLVGVIGLGAMVSTGVWTKRRADERAVAAVQAVHVAVDAHESELGDFRGRMINLEWQAGKLRAQAYAASTEPEKSWLRESSRLFDSLVATIEREAGEKEILAELAEIRALANRGDPEAAARKMKRLRAVRFPEPDAFRRIKAEIYERPLAQFSRQNPAYYRVFKEHEPDAARADAAALRESLQAVGVESMTPQALLGFELFAAVAQPHDPLVADWQTLTTAADFFEDPDQETLTRWRQAQEAVRALDWPTAVARMQSIIHSAARTRQPFRAAYGKAILKNRPGDTVAAYPFMQEAAAAGDVAARAWVSDVDVADGRFDAALPLLEARVADGENGAIPSLLAIYAMPVERVVRDREREFGTLLRIVANPDAPPLASMLLARHYEERDGDSQAAANALACYVRAAEQQHQPALMEVARCCFEGIGTAPDLRAAGAWAAKAFESGERARSVPMLLELMRRAPEAVAKAIQQMFSHEHVASPGGYTETRVEASGVAQLQQRLAEYLDRKGDYGAAARFYAQSGSRDAKVARRLGELTTARPCGECGGDGKTVITSRCSTCNGKGSLLCGACDGRGYNLVVGAPPCPTCGGTGGMVQDGRAVACAACTGTGKGKDSVTKKACGHCAAGKVACRACTSGQIKVTKDCAACDGRGSKSLADE